MLYDDVFTNEGELRRDYLIKRGLYSLPVIDDYDIFEAEWFVEAVKKFYPEVKKLEAYTFLCGSADLEQKTIDLSIDAIFDIDITSSYKYILITSSNLDFFVYMHHYHEHCIIAGTECFIRNAYKCSFETATKIFYARHEDDWPNLEAKKFFRNVWEMYAILP